MRKAGIKPCWNRQIEVSNHAGKHRPLPVGTKGMGCGSGNNTNNPLLRNWNGKAKLTIPKEYTFDSWCDTPEGVDREDLILMDSWVSSTEAKRRAKAVGGGQRIAMMFWLGRLVERQFIVAQAAKHYYQRFMSEMTGKRYQTLDQTIG